MRDTIEMAREAGFTVGLGSPALEKFERLIELVRADERMGFYGQDKPTECAEGCPPNQICDYCQVVAPVKARILAEREACAKACESIELDGYPTIEQQQCAAAIRARGTHDQR
jgi:hypothetical protein